MWTQLYDCLVKNFKLKVTGKIILPIICIVVTFIFCSGYINNTSDQSDGPVYCNPCGIRNVYVTPFHDPVEYINKARIFENELIKRGPKRVSLKKYFPLIFNYRDPIIIPVLKRIIKSKWVHEYYKLRAIHTFGEVASTDDFDYLLKLWPTSSPMKKEYIASAFSKIADSTHLNALIDLKSIEKNFYVVKTLEYCIKSINKNKELFFPNLPVIDTSSNYDKLDGFYIKGIRSTVEATTYKSDDSTVIVKSTDTIIAPHLQYKELSCIPNMIASPFISFAQEYGKSYYHVGEDCGNIFDGQPVHSISDGEVVFIQHEGSWGCLVAIASLFPKDEAVTVNYGHLSCNIAVRINQKVKAGDYIGEIGPSFSLQNGGYLSHLHLGIEKKHHTEAQIAGYSKRLDNWYNPTELIAPGKKVETPNKKGRWYQTFKPY